LRQYIKAQTGDEMVFKLAGRPTDASQGDGGRSGNEVFK